MTTLEERISLLNGPQREAVTHVGGPLLILAGAGSGKTRVLTHRIAWLVHSGLARPWEILAVTFTNKAAGEMKTRVESLLGSSSEGMWVSTFHSACLRLLRRHIDRLGFTSDFAIYDDGDQVELIKRILKDLKLPAGLNPRGVLARIDEAKNRLWTAERLDEESAGRDGVPHGRVFTAYNESLRRNNACDFNDLINHVLRLFEEEPPLLAKYRATFRHLLVDEYQDTNHAQYRLVTLLGKRDSPADEQVVVVGDDDQSIYSFRGADIRNILDFEKDFPGAKVVKLEKNYRSTQVILDAATAVVTRNVERKGKALWTDRQGGDLIEVRRSQDEREEGRKVAERIRQLQSTGSRFSQMAVFYRTNGQSRVLEESLGQARIPFVLIGGHRFYDRKEIKDVMAWLRILVNPWDDVAFVRAVGAPPRGIGDATLQKLRDQAGDMGLPLLPAIQRLQGQGELRTAAGKKLGEFSDLLETLRELSLKLPLPSLLRELYALSGYADDLEAEESHESRQRMENLNELLNQAASEFAVLPPPEGLRQFLDRAALVADTDGLSGEGEEVREKVTLMTIHCSKGLEYPVVMIAGMDEKVFPHVRAHSDPLQMAEERRLCYVAFTRAMNRLILFTAQRRMVAGQTFETTPSRFLRDVPRSLLALEGSPSTGAGRWSVSSPVVVPRPSSRGERVEYDELPSPVARGSGAARTSPSLSSISPASMGKEARRLGDDVLGPKGEPRVVRDAGEEGLRVGSRVRHERFGIGEVRRIEGPPHNQKLTIFFREAGNREILARYTTLEVITW